MIASRVEGDEHRGKGLIIGAILAIIMLPCILNFPLFKIERKVDFLHRNLYPSSYQQMPSLPHYQHSPPEGYICYN